MDQSSFHKATFPDGSPGPIFQFHDDPSSDLPGSSDKYGAWQSSGSTLNSGFAAVSSPEFGTPMSHVADFRSNMVFDLAPGQSALTGMTINDQTTEAKQRLRRASHNLVERRRRDRINSQIQRLSSLVPPSYLIDDQDIGVAVSVSSSTSPMMINNSNNNTHRRRRSTAGSSKPLDINGFLKEKLQVVPEKDPHKGQILTGAVGWTKDMMLAVVTSRDIRNSMAAEIERRGMMDDSFRDILSGHNGTLNRIEVDVQEAINSFALQVPDDTHPILGLSSSPPPGFGPEAMAEFSGLPTSPFSAPTTIPAGNRRHHRHTGSAASTSAITSGRSMWGDIDSKPILSPGFSDTASDACLGSPFAISQHPYFPGISESPIDSAFGSSLNGNYLHAAGSPSIGHPIPLSAGSIISSSNDVHSSLRSPTLLSASPFSTSPSFFVPPMGFDETPYGSHASDVHLLQPQSPNAFSTAFGALDSSSLAGNAAMKHPGSWMSPAMSDLPGTPEIKPMNNLVNML